MTNEVVVVGGGPTGILLGCELWLAGVETIVLQRLSQAERPLQSAWTPGSDDRDAGSPEVARAVQPRHCRTPFLNFGMFQ
jgi:2-polyprenyl-6-methoxyphenol hydroxylase-like FAD-dependent oxidoreductase